MMSEDTKCMSLEALGVVVLQWVLGPCNFSSATSARATGVGSWCGVFAYADAVVGLRVGFRVDGRVEGANV